MMPKEQVLTESGSNPIESPLDPRRRFLEKLLTIPRLVVFVREQMFGQIGLPQGGTNEMKASETDLDSIPIHGIVPENAGECPKGDSKGTQEKSSLNVIGESDHVGHQERGSDGEDFAGGLEANAAKADTAFGRSS